MSIFGTRIMASVVIALFAASPTWARVGVASVVNGEPKGLPPAGEERVLQVGNDMAPNERVTTGVNDKAHLVFLDGSSLTVGPNSVITIDKFVYDPERKSGELALNASRGVFRFVGGAISKNAEVTVKTPAATMGIRGGIATFAVANNGATTVNFLFGQSLTVTSPGGTTILTQPGTSTVAPGGNAPPTPPTPIPPAGPGSNRFFQQTAGSGNQPGAGQGNASAGGGGGRPSSVSIGAALAASGLSRANSAIAPSVALAAVPATQQAQLKTAAAQTAAAALQTAVGPQQAAGRQQTAEQQQAVGLPLAAGPEQGSGAIQSAGLLQCDGPLQGAGPLQDAGPLQNDGTSGCARPLPLQGAGPLQGALPLQAIGPGTGPMGTAGLAAPPIFAAATAFGPAPTNVGTLNQLLAQAMAGPNAPSPAVLTLFVNALTPPLAPSAEQSGPAPASAPTPAFPPASTTPILRPTTTQQPPPSLPPTIYVSDNNVSR